MHGHSQLAKDDMRTPTVENHSPGHSQNHHHHRSARHSRMEEVEEEMESITVHPRAFAVWGHDESDSSAASDSDA